MDTPTYFALTVLGFSLTIRGEQRCDLSGAGYSDRDDEHPDVCDYPTCECGALGDCRESARRVVVVSFDREG